MYTLLYIISYDLVMIYEIRLEREKIMEKLDLLAGLAHTKNCFGTGTKMFPFKIRQHFQACLNTVVTS